MSAPLYSRYARYADREAQRFPRGAPIAKLVPMWKRPQTRVYSMSARASHEAGWWSGEDPGEILRAIGLHYLPSPWTWIEFDWRSYNKGSLRLPLDTPDNQHYPGGGMTNVVNGPTSPVRMAFMFFRPGWATKVVGAPKWEAGHKDEGIMALLFYLYPNGGCFVGPPIVYWHPEHPLAYYVSAPDIGPNLLSPPEFAIGRSYVSQYGGKQPRLTDRLMKQVGLTSIGANVKVPWEELDGTTRCAIAVLTATLAARPPAYPETPTPGPARDRKPEWGTKERPIEVDLFIRERPRKPGGSIRASVGHLEGIKKGLHTVGAHYAYRNRADGKDPTKCPTSETGVHDFEDIPGTKSQVCVMCGQKRWFKDQHQRGDEAYGVVPQKIRNVRLGAQTRTLMTQEGTTQ